MIKKLRIVGCGGHSKVVIDALSQNTDTFEVSLCDKNSELLGKEVAGILITSTTDSLPDFEGFIHVAIGDNQSRKSIYHSIHPNAAKWTIIHPAATVARSAQIGGGSFIAAGSILGPDSVIGEACIINHGAVVDHEVHVGSYSHIAPNSTLGGKVTLGKGVLIGAGAVVLPGIHIGDGALIAAGAVVIRNVKEYSLVKGVPAM